MQLDKVEAHARHALPVIGHSRAVRRGKLLHGGKRKLTLEIGGVMILRRLSYAAAADNYERGGQAQPDKADDMTADGVPPPAAPALRLTALLQRPLKLPQSAQLPHGADDGPDSQRRKEKKDRRPKLQNGAQQTDALEDRRKQKHKDPQRGIDRRVYAPRFYGPERQRLHGGISIQLPRSRIVRTVDVELAAPRNVFPAVLGAKLHLLRVRLIAVAEQARILLRGLQPVLDALRHGALEHGHTGKQTVLFQQQALAGQIGQPALRTFHVIVRAGRQAQDIFRLFCFFHRLIPPPALPRP